mgnify:CR=1 FL=1
MTNNQLTEIAKIIGVSMDSISAMDENIKADMVAALTEKNADKTALYNELDRLWQKGSVYIGLAEIARNTGISLVALHSLDLSTQQELVFEYMANSSQTEHFYEVNFLTSPPDTISSSCLYTVVLPMGSALPLKLR